jgi:hypothetical protein
MSRGTLAIVLILCGTWAAAEQAVTPPPHPLHKIGDHWTPYQPPTEFPADANLYTIQPHDTLWDLAKKFLGNPYLWPQLWEKNKYISDAHWIYPGDPLVVGVKAKEVPATGAETTPSGQPATTATQAPATTEAAPAAQQGEAANLVPVGSEDDLYCFAYLADPNEKPKFTISSAEDIGQKEDFVTGDIVFISGGSEEGVKAGQEYFVVLPDHIVRHPATNAVLGRAVRYIGRLRVLCTQDHSSTAEIIAACDGIPIGSWLKPFEPMPIPMTVLTASATVCDQPNAKPKGYIIYSKDDDVSFGADHVVLIDLGDADQVAPGTVCTIYRDNPVKGMPRLLLGELAVLTTGQHWASAKIIRSSQYMGVGDRVEVK